MGERPAVRLPESRPIAVVLAFDRRSERTQAYRIVGSVSILVLFHTGVLLASERVAGAVPR